MHKLPEACRGEELRAQSVLDNFGSRALSQTVTNLACTKPAEPGTWSLGDANCMWRSTAQPARSTSKDRTTLQLLCSAREGGKDGQARVSEKAREGQRSGGSEKTAQRGIHTTPHRCSRYAPALKPQKICTGPRPAASILSVGHRSCPAGLCKEHDQLLSVPPGNHRYTRWHRHCRLLWS